MASGSYGAAAGPLARVGAPPRSLRVAVEAAMAGEVTKTHPAIVADAGKVRAEDQEMEGIRMETPAAEVGGRARTGPDPTTHNRGLPGH